jgi:hypothetical protein
MSFSKDCKFCKCKSNILLHYRLIFSTFAAAVEIGGSLNSVIRCYLGYPNPDKCAKLMDELSQ